MYIEWTIADWPQESMVCHRTSMKFPDIFRGYEMGYESFNLNLLILLLTEVTEASLQTEIVNCLNTHGKFISYNVDKFVFIF